MFLVYNSLTRVHSDRNDQATAPVGKCFTDDVCTPQRTASGASGRTATTLTLSACNASLVPITRRDELIPNPTLDAPHLLSGLRLPKFHRHQTTVNVTTIDVSTIPRAGIVALITQDHGRQRAAANYAGDRRTVWQRQKIGAAKPPP